MTLTVLQLYQIGFSSGISIVTAPPIVPQGGGAGGAAVLKKWMRSIHVLNCYTLTIVDNDGRSKIFMQRFESTLALFIRHNTIEKTAETYN